MKILQEYRFRKTFSSLVEGLIVVLLFCLFLLVFEKKIGWALAAWPLIISSIFILSVIKLFFRLDEGLFLSLKERGVKGPYNLEKKIYRWVEPRKTAFSITLVTAVIALGLLEITLRRTLDYLPADLANHLGHGYQLTGSGIYRFDGERKTARMRKNYEREMYFNGFRWWHRTDKFGYRNPGDRNRADVVLLGDSIIYGHGLEEDSTVRSHLETMVNLPVANLGQQGAGIHCAYQILKHDGVLLQPKLVFLFFLNNDINDLTLNLNELDRSSFLKIPIGDHTSRYVSTDKKVTRLLRGWETAFQELYIVKGGTFFLNSLTKKRRSSLYPEGNSAPPDLSVANPANRNEPRDLFSPDPYLESKWRMLPPFASNSALQQAMQFHLRALLKIKALAENNKFKFTYVFIYTGLPYDDLFLDILSSFCEVNNINFLNMKSIFENAQANGDLLFLPRDGHFTSRGAYVTADALANIYPLPSLSGVKE